MTPRAANEPAVTAPEPAAPATPDVAPDADHVRVLVPGNGNTPISVSDGLTVTTYEPRSGSVRVAPAHLGAVLGAIAGSSVAGEDES